jgi:hypothetical protein
MAIARASGHPLVPDRLQPQEDDNDPFTPSQLARKRPFDSEGDSQAHINQPPKKKARFVATSKNHLQPATTQDTKENGRPDLPRVCFRKVSLPSGKVSKAIKTFESLIVHPTLTSHPLTPKKAKDIAIS